MKVALYVFKVWIIAAFSIGSFAQSDVEPQPYDSADQDSIYFADYKKLKDLYVVYMLSPTFQKSREQLRDYRSKLKSGKQFDIKLLSKDPGGLNWLRDNWHKTGFTSYDEALQQYKTIADLLDAPSSEKQAFDDYHFETSLKYGPEMFLDMYREVMIEYSDKW